MKKYKVKQKLIEWILIIILINHLKKFKNKYIKKHNKNKLKNLIHLFNILTESEVQNTAVPSKEANLDYKIIKK